MNSTPTGSESGPIFAKWTAICMLLTTLFFSSGLSCRGKPPVVKDQGVNVMLDWNRFILHAETQTEGYRVPVAARLYAYSGLAAYESALPGLPAGNRSFQTDLKGLQLPVFEAGSDHFCTAAALNACYATLLEKFFNAAPQNIKDELNGIKTRWENKLSANNDSTGYKRAQLFGTKVAEAVYNWSAEDSLGHLANFHNYDRNFIPPKGPGKWTPSEDFPMPPLLPYWGQTRSFVVNAADFPVTELPPFSAAPNSVYYRQALEVLTLGSPLSPENQWVAEFWSDDHTGLTFTPAGHWLAITNQVIEAEQPDIYKALETYLRIGFALNDAIILVWRSKYTYNLERPESFIRREFPDAEWKPFGSTPPFPSYPSGHAAMGAAAAEVLSDLYGNNYAMTDACTVDRQTFSVPARKFKSFREMAIENAYSRILLGVHFRMDCDEGLRLGTAVGKQVVQFETRKKVEN